LKSLSRHGNVFSNLFFPGPISRLSNGPARGWWGAPPSLPSSGRCGPTPGRSGGARGGALFHSRVSFPGKIEIRPSLPCCPAPPPLPTGATLKYSSLFNLPALGLALRNESDGREMIYLGATDPYYSRCPRVPAYPPSGPPFCPVRRWVQLWCPLFVPAPAINPACSSAAVRAPGDRPIAHSGLALLVSRVPPRAGVWCAATILYPPCRDPPPRFAMIALSASSASPTGGADCPMRRFFVFPT